MCLYCASAGRARGSDGLGFGIIGDLYYSGMTGRKNAGSTNLARLIFERSVIHSRARLLREVAVYCCYCTCRYCDNYVQETFLLR